MAGDFDLLTDEQLDTLRTLARQGVTIDACEFITVRWPSGARNYSFAPFDAIEGFKEGLARRGIVCEPRKASGYFTTLRISDELEDDTIPVRLLDHDRAVTALLALHGPGHQVEVYYFFPQADALVSVWWGNLRPPQEGGKYILDCSAASGFRNQQTPEPHRQLFSGKCQSPQFGGDCDTLAEVHDMQACGWNLSLGGDKGLPGSELLQPCTQESEAMCQLYWGDTLSFVAANTIVESIYNGQTSGPALQAKSVGNETNLKNPVRVVFGERKIRDLEPTAYTRQSNTNHPDQGFVRVLMPGPEGTIKSMTECAVNDRLIGFEHLQVRLGTERQPRTGFSPNCSNMSWTAHYFGVWGQVDPAQYNATNLRGSCKVEGLANVRVYTDEVTFTEEYTRLRSWGLFELLRNQRFGRGYNVERFEIERDWIPLAARDATPFKYHAADGTERTAPGCTFNAELVGRPGSEQFRDICLWGGYQKPFRHNGKVRIAPLRKATPEELESAPVFTDEGPDANIVIDKDDGPQITWTMIDPAALTNEIVVTFDDEEHSNAQRPVTFARRWAQKAAAKALGDRGHYVVSKPHSALGITREAELVRRSWMVLDLGEFEEGGLYNNFAPRLLTNIFEAMNLYRGRVVKVVSKSIEDFKDPDKNPFVYFRVKDIERRDDLYAYVYLQAYNHAYFERMEAEAEGEPDPEDPTLAPNPGGDPRGRPCSITIETLDFGADFISVRLRECEDFI